MGNSPSGSAEFRFPLELPEEMREELRRPLGKLLQGHQVLASLGKGRVATVGDFCTLDLIQRGGQPDIAIVDHMTRRAPSPGGATAFSGWPGARQKVRNPAGVITEELWTAVDEAFKSSRRVLIEVQGEEDLGALPCIALAPEGSHVLYGLAGRGVVLVVVDEGSRSRALEIIGRMRHGRSGTLQT